MPGPHRHEILTIPITDISTADAQRLNQLVAHPESGVLGGRVDGGQVLVAIDHTQNLEFIPERDIVPPQKKA